MASKSASSTWHRWFVAKASPRRPRMKTAWPSRVGRCVLGSRVRGTPAPASPAVTGQSAPPATPSRSRPSRRRPRSTAVASTWLVDYAGIGYCAAVEVPLQGRYASRTAPSRVSMIGRGRLAAGPLDPTAAASTAASSSTAHLGASPRFQAGSTAARRGGCGPLRNSAGPPAPLRLVEEPREVHEQAEQGDGETVRQRLFSASPNAQFTNAAARMQGQLAPWHRSAQLSAVSAVPVENGGLGVCRTAHSARESSVMPRGSVRERPVRSAMRRSRMRTVLG